MGVVCVLQYKVPEGKSGQQAVDMLQRRVEDLGAIKTGSFTLDCDTYHAVQASSPQRVVSVLHNSEHPASCFAVLDTGTCLVADTLLDLLMLKLEGFYASRKNTRVESKGQRYELGDFIIKIGSVILGQNTSFKGILLEVEYVPCVVPMDCWNLMKEFLQGLLAQMSDGLTAGLTTHFKNKMDVLYTPGDTVVQYLEHFNNFRKAATPPVR